MASEQTKRNTTIDINALTAAAVAELHKQQKQNTPASASNPETTSSAIQQQLQQQFSQQKVQERGQGQTQGGVDSSVAAKKVQSSDPSKTILKTQQESCETAEAHMPARHGWEVDWLSSELVKAREEISKLMEENAQLRMKLETHNKFVVHGSRPVTQATVNEIQNQQAALDALIKAQQQQQNLQQLALQQALGMQSGQIQNAMPAQPLDQSMLLPQTMNQLAGLVSKTNMNEAAGSVTSSMGNLGGGGVMTQLTKSLHEPQAQPLLQQQLLGGSSEGMDLKSLLQNQSVSANSAMDIAKVEKLLLAVQKATKNGNG